MIVDPIQNIIVDRESGEPLMIDFGRGVLLVLLDVSRNNAGGTSKPWVRPHMSSCFRRILHLFGSHKTFWQVRLQDPSTPQGSRPS